MTMQKPAGRWALLLGLIVWALVLQREALVGMVTVWNLTDTYTHCYLVLPIALWLGWRERAKAKQIALRTSHWGLVALGAASLMAALGDLASVNAVRHFALVFTLQSLVWLVMGNAFARAFWFPLVFLWFAPPFGEFLMPQMMGWTADFTVAALRLTGIPVYREGLQFVIPSGHWSVVEACSGIRYLMASVMVGSLFAYLNFDRWPRRLGFMVFATVVPVVANWLRAYFIVLLGHFSGNELATGADHLVYGWVFFGLIMMGMFWVGGRYADPVAPASGANVGEQHPVSRLAVDPGWLWGALLAVLLLAAPVAWLHHVRAAAATAAPPASKPEAWRIGLEAQLRAALGTLPNESSVAPSTTAAATPAKTAAGWLPTAPHTPNWAPAYVNPDIALQTHWQRPGDSAPVTFDLVVYLHQRQDAKLVSSVNTLVPSHKSEWVRLSRSVQTVDGVVQEETTWRHRQGQGVSQDFRVRQLMLVGAHYTSSPVRAKLLGAWQLVRGDGDTGSGLVWMTADDPQAAQRLDAFWRDIRTALPHVLRPDALSVGAHNAPLAASVPRAHP